MDITDKKVTNMMNSYNQNLDFEQNESFVPADHDETSYAAQAAADGVYQGLNALHNQALQNGATSQDAVPLKAKVTTKIELDKEKSLKNDARYFYGFSSNLLKLDLTPTEFKIIVYILETLKWGNVVAMTQKSIANSTGISPSVVNRNWKSLIAKYVLIVDENGSIYLNTNFFFIGLYKDMDKQRREDFEKASGFNDDIKHMHNSPGTVLK